jgi:hypothetical protein
LLKSLAAGTPRELPGCFVNPFAWFTGDGPTDPAVAGPFPGPLSTFFITAVPPFFFFEGVLSPPPPALAEGELDCGPLPGTVRRLLAAPGF